MTGFDKHAAALLDKFSWGHSFWEINGCVLSSFLPSQLHNVDQALIDQLVLPFAEMRLSSDGAI